MTTRVLFVCLGNICRSPSAQGVFEALLDARALASAFQVDSAGTGGYHAGEAPDRRARLAASQRGYDISHLRAREVTLADFDTFDLILAMDQANLNNLRQRAPANCHASIDLFMRYAPDWPDEVPDPYFGGEQGFESVLDMLEAASAGLLDRQVSI